MSTTIRFRLFAAAILTGLLGGNSGAGAQQPAPIIEWPGLELPADAQPREPVPQPRSAAMPQMFQGEHVAFLDGPNAADILLADVEAQARNGHKPGPPRMGIVRAMPGGRVASIDPVVLQTALDGGQSMWTFALQSGGAYAMRVHFSDVDLRGCTLIAYSWSRRGGLIAAGPFTRRGFDGGGDFWTATLPGEKVFIEAVGPQRPQFSISEIVHYDKDPSFSVADGGSNGGGVLSCQLDAMCAAINNNTTAPRKATGQMNYVSGGNSYVCSGTLLNDQDSETVVPYFLTAYHCLHTQTEVNTLEVVWLWEHDFCNSSNTPDYFSLPRNTGGTLVASNPTSTGNDMTFIRLAGGVQPGVALVGWTTATGLVEAWGFHHPSGSWKRYTYFGDVGICPTCVCEDPAQFDYYDMLAGMTEGGSSGSGIFTASGLIAGQLLGRCSNHPSDDMNCNNVGDFKAMYGEFQETYPLISVILAIGGTIHVNAAMPFDGNGTPGQPFKFVASGHSAAWNGAHIKIVAGNYNETLTLNKNVLMLAEGGTVTIGQ